MLLKINCGEDAAKQVVSVGDRRRTLLNHGKFCEFFTVGDSRRTLHHPGEFCGSHFTTLANSAGSDDKGLVSNLDEPCVASVFLFRVCEPSQGVAGRIPGHRPTSRRARVDTMHCGVVRTNMMMNSLWCNNQDCGSQCTYHSLITCVLRRLASPSVMTSPSYLPTITKASTALHRNKPFPAKGIVDRFTSWGGRFTPGP